MMNRFLDVQGQDAKFVLPCGELATSLTATPFGSKDEWTTYERGSTVGNKSHRFPLDHKFELVISKLIASLYFGHLLSHVT